MKDWRVSLGVLVGVLAAAAFLIAGGHHAPRVAPGAMLAHGSVLSDCDGAIKQLVIQYVPEAASIVEAAYQQFLGALPADVSVIVVCPDNAAFEDFRSRVGDVSCRLVPVLTAHAITCWSRDRWLAMTPAGGGRALLVSPLMENAAAIWPQREGDSRIGDDLARVLPDSVISHRSKLLFDGGDFVADNEAVFVTPRVARRNVGVTVASLDELRRELARIVKRRVILLDDAPPHHAGMFMMLAGDRTAVVGDPSMAAILPLLTPLTDHTESWPLDNPDFSAATQRRFDAVAAQCKAAGYRVVRIPVVPGRDGRTYLTYLNAILDERGGRRTVYMPVYEGAESANAAAEVVWRKLGFAVSRIDCTNTYKHFGSLRCLVNVRNRSKVCVIVGTE